MNGCEKLGRMPRRHVTSLLGFHLKTTSQDIVSTSCTVYHFHMYILSLSPSLFPPPPLSLSLSLPFFLPPHNQNIKLVLWFVLQVIVTIPNHGAVLTIPPDPTTHPEVPIFMSTQPSLIEMMPAPIESEPTFFGYTSFCIVSVEAKCLCPWSTCVCVCVCVCCVCSCVVLLVLWWSESIQQQPIFSLAPWEMHREVHYSGWMAITYCCMWNCTRATLVVVLLQAPWWRWCFIHEQIPLCFLSFFCACYCTGFSACACRVRKEEERN